MKYRIVADYRTLCVEKRTVKGEKSENPGEVVWVKDSWPGNLNQTAVFLLNRITVDKAAQRDTTDVRELVKAIEDATSEVKECVARYTGTALVA